MELEQLIKQNLPNNRKEWIWFILIILVVATLGIVAVNQYLAIQYKATLIQAPCNLCDSYIRQMNSNIKLGGLNLSVIPLS
jgi:hypothetical protein